MNVITPLKSLLHSNSYISPNPDEYEEIKTGDFPRVMSDHPSAGPSTDSTYREPEPRPERSERASKGGKAPKAGGEAGSDSSRVEESPKREQRKRTRLNVTNSPATSDTTPKRPRRN